MNPWRAALTSATASGNRTRMASRRASACSSGPPLASTRPSAAAVSSTAVFSVKVANCSRCASATDSACCSANSRRPRISSSGSPPEGKLKPPSMAFRLPKLTLVAGLDLVLELLDDGGSPLHGLHERRARSFTEGLLEPARRRANGVQITRCRHARNGADRALEVERGGFGLFDPIRVLGDRKSTRLNSSHVAISY